MKIIHEPAGICSRLMKFDFEDGIIRNVEIRGGCDGNSRGIAGLLEGMKAEDAVAKMKGIRCGTKKTSCPDQLAIAIEKCTAGGVE